MSFYLNITMI